MTKVVLNKLQALLEKTHTVGPSYPKKGAPTGMDRARAFDPKDKKGQSKVDRSWERPDKPGYSAVEHDSDDNGVWVHVVNYADFEKRKERPKDSYYGVNVFFYKDESGEPEDSTSDKYAAAQWREDKAKIIKTAEAYLKKQGIKLGENLDLDELLPLVEAGKIKFDPTSDGMFGYEDRSNAIALDKHLRSNGFTKVSSSGKALDDHEDKLAFSRQHDVGFHMFHFKSNAARNKAMKMAKGVVDLSKEPK